MSEVLDEIRDAYALFGIEIDGVATYGTYYRIRCGRCERLLGTVGDKLLKGMADGLLKEQFDLYAAGLLGCECGYQAERARMNDSARADVACARLKTS